MNQIIVLGSGCFWCSEAVFQNLKGIIGVTSGYSGGESINPTYQSVCTGQTGHAEVIKVEYNELQITVNDILSVFFTTHDPTQINRQGHDVGTQYRSAIFYTTEEQRQSSENFIKKLTEDKVYDQPIVTEVKLLSKFYPAESYHHNYYQLHPEQAYCQAIINPKLKKLKEKYSQLLRP
ncbi:MAG: peptide-methionine (S)-S-oxide reductase MsrA [Candidatus Komeilibacteria bacterium]|nr:peptide-methionine (S)-S-oxide reductase MsrA [Candidatus Komeilibacteria bacterium]